MTGAGPSPPRFIPLTLSWNLTRRCNLACAHCYIDASGHEKGENELTTGECLETLKQVARLNPEAFLILTGGEPLLRRDIFELVRAASGLGFWTVLGSHGGLMDRSAARELARAGLRGVGVSLDSLDPAKHDAFRGIPKAWEHTVAALDALREERLPFLIETTITKMNRAEIPALPEFAAAQGATALNVFFLVPTGRGAKVNDLTPAEYEESLGLLADLQERFAGRLLINAKCAPHYRRVLWERNPQSEFVRTFRGGGCPAGTYYARIGPTGDVTPCPYMPLAVGNVRSAPFDEIWERSEIMAQFRTERRGGRCGACEFDELCGGCRCRAYAMTGDYLAEDPSCVYQPGKYDRQRTPLPPERTYGATAESSGIAWTPEAEARLSQVPFFARGMVRQAVESAARARNVQMVTADLMAELRSTMAGRLPFRKG
ncbi:MAG: radical SAM protein [Nitrospirae bacterium]|nr:radical SAM protein [Nitrospirota bacterium]